MEFFLVFCTWMTMVFTLGEIRVRLKELTEKVDRLQQDLALPGRSTAASPDRPSR